MTQIHFLKIISSKTINELLFLQNQKIPNIIFNDLLDIHIYPYIIII